MIMSSICNNHVNFFSIQSFTSFNVILFTSANCSLSRIEILGDDGILKLNSCVNLDVENCERSYAGKSQNLKIKKTDKVQSEMFQIKILKDRKFQNQATAKFKDLNRKNVRLWSQEIAKLTIPKAAEFDLGRTAQSSIRMLGNQSSTVFCVILKTVAFVSVHLECMRNPQTQKLENWGKKFRKKKSVARARNLKARNSRVNSNKEVQTLVSISRRTRNTSIFIRVFTWCPFTERSQNQITGTSRDYMDVYRMKRLIATRS